MKVGAGAREHVGFLASHAESFKRVAAYNNCIVMCRAPGPYAPGLISEGYSSKGFHNKAKSCNWGPMAGFVLFDPLFSKRGLTAKGYKKQKKDVRQCMNQGGLLTPLVITDKRFTWLRKNNFIKRYKPNSKDDCAIKGRRVQRYQATLADWRKTDGELKGDLSYLKKARDCIFYFKEAAENGKVVWRITYKKRSSQKDDEMVDAIVDPTYSGGIPDFRKATTADYDLFAVWGPQTGPRRPPREEDVTAYERPVGPEKLNSKIDLALREDPERGNVSPFLATMCDRLNAEMTNNRFGGARFNYTGGNMVHHSDEAGRPFIDEIDFPFIAFLPRVSTGKIALSGGNTTIVIESVEEFAQFIAQSDKAGYNIELNPAWVLQLQKLGKGPGNDYQDFLIRGEDYQGL